MTPTSHDHPKLGDDEYHQLQLLNDKKQSSSFTIPSHVLSYSNIQDRGSYYPTEAQLENQEANNFASEGGPSNDQVLKFCLWKKENRQGYNISGRHYQKIPTKWLPSKLRLVRKMMSSNRAATKAPSNFQIGFEKNHKQGSLSPNETSENSYNSSSSTTIRVCSDCNTTKTPLWRSGPRGPKFLQAIAETQMPKSLCNACGIRQRKARRALAAAALPDNDTTLSVEGTTGSKPKEQQNGKRLKTNTKISACKKKSKLGKHNERKNKCCFEDFLISLSKNMVFHQVFPQDEKEAAILLMALSSGLVHG